MKPMDAFNKGILSEENAKKFLNKNEYSKFLLLSYEEKSSLLKELLEKPIYKYTVINELYFRSKWADLIKLLYSNKPITVLEVASGDADMIPQTMARCNPKSTYITANMNKILNNNMLNKTKDLNLKITLIEDDAANIKKHIGMQAADIIAFQHGVNDVLQAILCSKTGIDTTYADWMELLPKMIQLLQKEIKCGTFEQNVKPAFFKLISNLSDVLKNDGIIAINHYMFQLDLNLGYPADLFENLISIVRNWLPELEIYEEVFYDNFDPQWWMFLKKHSN